MKLMISVFMAAFIFVLPVNLFGQADEQAEPAAPDVTAGSAAGLDQPMEKAAGEEPKPEPAEPVLEPSEESESAKEPVAEPAKEPEPAAPENQFTKTVKELELVGVMSMGAENRVMLKKPDGTTLTMSLGDCLEDNENICVKSITNHSVVFYQKEVPEGVDPAEFIYELKMTE